MIRMTHALAGSESLPTWVAVPLVIGLSVVAFYLLVICPAYEADRRMKENTAAQRTSGASFDSQETLS